ncbi:MAG: zinc finger domain-containing protein, partial [Pseudoalteromonas spongiae]
MSFTAQEIWQVLPGKRDEFVFTGEWYQGLVKADSAKLDNAFWQQLLEVRAEVNKVLEAARKEEKIGATLQAEVTLYVGAELEAQLNALGDELRFVLLTSKAAVENKENRPADAVASEIDGLFISVAATSAEKCERCWHYCDDVGTHEEHKDICGRCVTNVDGEGEVRQFA